MNADCLDGLINIKLETKNEDILLSKVASTTIPVMITLQAQE